MFETYLHSGPGNVVIDNCTACDVIWLDFGEIRQIVDAPGRDRGAREIHPVDDEYVRRGPESDDEGELERGGRDTLRLLAELLFR